MIEYATVARPYAKALFELAEQESQVKAWQKELAQFAWLVQQSNVMDYLEQSDFNSLQKADELVRLLSSEHSPKIELFNNFIRIVVEEKRLEIVPQIYVQYQQLMLAKENVREATIFIAYDVASEGQQAKIVSDLEQRFNVKLHATFKVDRDLIGGLKVVVGDQVLDLSVQGKLKQLYATMTN